MIKTRTKKQIKEQENPVEIKWDESKLPEYLDPQQRLAVATKADKAIVLAAAGSGKTRVITERVNYLVNCGVPAVNIVCITFTIMAAEEMRERLKGNPKVNEAFIGTIHSFANKIMKTTNERFQLFSEELSIAFHKKLINKYCKHLTFDGWVKFKDTLDEELESKVPVGTADSTLLFSQRSELSLIERPLGNEDKDYPETIETLCKAGNIISFNELLRKATTYFRNTNSFPEYVLVDEFQDVGELEYSFVMSLNAKNYLFVGDDWQSIYSFKGGNVGIFKSLCRDEKWTKYYLENNYRSGKLIIDLADKIIKQCEGKIEKSIKAVSKVNAQFCVESKYKFGAILNEIAKDEKELGDWFILVRKNADLMFVVNELRKKNIANITFKREGMSLSEMKLMMGINAIKVLTVHVAKGLESKNVLIYGDGFKLTRPDWMKNDEEVRIMYVAVTRAKENLIVLN